MKIEFSEVYLSSGQKDFTLAHITWKMFLSLLFLILSLSDISTRTFCETRVSHPTVSHIINRHHITEQKPTLANHVHSISLYSICISRNCEIVRKALGSYDISDSLFRENNMFRSSALSLRGGKPDDSDSDGPTSNDRLVEFEDGERVLLCDVVLRAIERALAMAKGRRHIEATPAHVLLSILQDPGRPARR